jgi:hypothetical protein
LEAQNRRLATIIEPAIAIFVLLCGAAVAAFVRMERANGTPRNPVS